MYNRRGVIKLFVWFGLFILLTPVCHANSNRTVGALNLKENLDWGVREIIDHQAFLNQYYVQPTPTQEPTPTPTPTLTPTPTTQPTQPPSALNFLAQLKFSGMTLEENQVSVVGAGFGQYPMPEVYFGAIPSAKIYPHATDGQGMIVIADPGEGVMIQTQPMQTANTALLRCWVRTEAPHASVYLASIDHGQNIFVSTITANNGNYFLNKYSRIADFFIPPSTGFQGILQIINTSQTEPLRVYVDNFEIIELGQERIEIDVKEIISD